MRSDLRRRWRATRGSVSLLLMLVIVFTLMPGTPARALHQILWWSEQAESQTTFGPNSQIRIWGGTMEYVAACIGGGTPDFIYPWTDIYIVPAGSVGMFGELSDAGGGPPNTVQSMGASGVFMDELIGTTAPTGQIGPGTYDVIYDECQDGRYDPQDVRFPNAFTVVQPVANVPPLPSLSGEKADAEKQYERLEKFEKLIDKLFSAGGKYDKGGTSYGFGKVTFVSVVTDPRQGAMIQLGNLAKHYKGIAADPPDPAFQQVSALGARTAVDFLSDDPLDQAIAEYLTQASSEAAIAEALLHSLERYQGADAANDGSWALLHAWAIQDNANLLSLQLSRSSSALVALANALAADPRPFDAVAADLQAFRDRVAASGFSGAELLDMRNSGWTDAQMEQFRQWVGARAFAFTVTELLNEISAHIAENNAMMETLSDLFTAMGGIAGQLQTDPAVAFQFPLADAGGPYTGAEGSPVSFSGAGSSSPTPIVTYEWDFDNDGLFNDATGATPTFTFTRAYRGLVGLKVTNDLGNANIAYAPVTISNINRPPLITDHAPPALGVTLEVGATQTFAVTGADPDGDMLAYDWELHGIGAGSGPAFTFSPTAAQLGVHTLDATVTDSSPLGGSTRVRWRIEVMMPDDDGDGWRQNLDCNDTDPAVNPGAAEIIGNGKDDDCDGATPDAPPVTVIAPAGQSGAEGAAAAIDAGAFTDTASDGPYTVDIDWGDAGAHTVLSAAAFGPIGMQGHTWGDSGTYTVTVTVTDATGGSAAAAFPVTVANLPPAAVLTAPAAADVGDTFALNMTGAADPSAADAAAGFTYAFDCGAGYGAFGSADSATCTAAAAGATTVRAQVRDKDGGTGEYTATVQVNGPVAVVAAAAQSAAEGAAASFVTGSFTDGGPDGPWTVDVDWGDASAHTSFTAAAPGALPVQVHTYADSGLYTVTVTVTDATGQQDAAAFPVTVANLPPTAAFVAPAAAIAGQMFALSLTGAADPSSADTAAGLAYAFDCGAGYGAAGPATTADCTAAGTGPLTVRAQVQDKDGGTSEYTAAVQVNAVTSPPVAFFSPNGSGRNVALKESGAAVHSFSSQFSASAGAATLIDANPANQYWRTLNGQTSGWVKIDLMGETWVIDRVRVMPAASPATERVKEFAVAVSTTGTADGDFTTVLTATAANSDQLQEFALPQPAPAKYVRFTALNNRGSACCVGTQQFQVISGQQGGATVTFQNRSADPDGDILSHAWEFGDGAAAAEASPTHTYAAPGTYPVTLTVTDGTGKSGALTLAYRVLTPPVASMKTNLATANEGQSITFTDTSADPDGGAIVSRVWQWGDGSADTATFSATAVHSYPDNGTYTVTLTVTDDQGQTATVTQAYTTQNANPSVSASGNQSVLWGVPLQPATAAVNDPGLNDRPTLQCRWSFGDGATHGPGPCSDQAYLRPAHAWANPGAYTRAITVTDKDGGTISFSGQVTVTRHNASVSYHGVRTAGAGTVTLGARLRDLSAGGYVAGRTVSWTVAGQTVTGVTGPDGIATADVTILAPAAYPVTVSFAGDSHYNASASDYDRLLVGVADTALVTAGAALTEPMIMCRANTTVNLQVTGTNPSTAAVPLDIALVIDVSGSMSGEKMLAAKNAARYFVRIVDRESDGAQDGTIRGSRIAVIPFHGEASVGRFLSANAGDLDAYIASLNAGGGTAIHRGVEVGQAELVAGHKLGNKPVLIVLSDGGSSRTAAYAAANAAKAAGTELFSIALGNGADRVLMDGIASDPKATHSFFSPDTAQLEGIYSQIADSATGPAATNVVVTVQVAPAFTVSPAAITPAPSAVSGNTITWTIPELKGETKSFAYQVQHAGPGGGPLTVNQSATVTYTDTQGSPQSLPFPAVTAQVACDEAPPVTNISLDGNLGSNSWYRSDVQVTLSAADHPAGIATGVAATEYSLDGGNTWLAYTAPFTVSGDGLRAVMARSRDVAGNQESPPASAAFQVDATPPVIAAAPGAGSAGALISLDAAATADALSGLDRIEWDFDGNGTVDATGPTVSNTWPVSGTYSVAVRASDLAGNAANAVLTVTVTAGGGGPCEPVAWKAPLSPDGTGTASLSAPLALAFTYHACSGFLHDESVLIMVTDRASAAVVTAWVYGSEISIDDGAREYRVTFDPALYGLTAGQELEFAVYIADGPVGRAVLRMAP